MDLRIKYVSHILPGWNYSGVLGTEAIADLVEFDTDAASGVALTRVATGSLSNTTITAGGTQGTGDAAWVASQYTAAVIKLNGGATLEDTYSGLDNGKTYTAEAYGINSSAGKYLDISADSRTDRIETNANLSETVKITGISPVAGEIVVTYGGDGDQYMGASRLYEDVAPPGPSASLDDDILEPGKAMTGTYANFASAPTAVTVTDSGGNSISSATEITDLVINDTAKTYGFTVPARRTSGTGKTLLRGPCTVELT